MILDQCIDILPYRYVLQIPSHDSCDILCTYIYIAYTFLKQCLDRHKSARVSLGVSITIASYISIA